MKQLPIIFSILCAYALSACSGSNSYRQIAMTDSLIDSHPDSALKILDGINHVGRLSEEGMMHYSWNRATAHYNLGMSLEEDTMILAASQFYRHSSDKRKALESYILSASYLNWTGKSAQAIAFLDKGTAEAITQKNDILAAEMIAMKSEILNRDNKYAQSAELLKKAIALNLPQNKRIGLIYQLAISLALANNSSSSAYFEQAAELAKASADKDALCEIIRNYSATLSSTGKYRKSNDLLFRINKINPTFFGYSAIQMSIAENYINLHRLDSARYYINIAKKSEALLQAIGQSDLNRQASIERICYLLDFSAGKPVSSIKFSRYCDSVTTAMLNKDNSSMRRLEMKNRLLAANTGLHSDITHMAWWITSLVILIAIAAIGIYLFYKNRYRKLAEAEDNIDILKKMLDEIQASNLSQNHSADTDNAFFKKILLQQLGIIRLVASTPTNQNQALLRRISGIGEGDIPTNNLLVWSDLYSVIDRLYENFHSILSSKFGSTLSDKEIQICCLLCAGFSTKEIGVITQQTNATIYVRKTSIRKKIGATEGEDIVAHIRAI